MCSTASADTIWTETFETDGQGTRYSSTTEFLDSTEDYYGRFSNSNTDRSYTSVEGDYWWGGQDQDDAGIGPGFDACTNTFTGINISGFSNLVFKGLFAEQRPEASGADDIDSTDYIHVQYQLDSGGWQNLLWFESIASLNTPFQIDTNFDGTGDGPGQLETDFTDFSLDIAGTGSSLDLRVIGRVDSGDEDWAMDNLRIEGIPSGPVSNNAPVLGAIGDRSVTVSNALNFSVSATDSDNDPIVLSVSNLPPGAVFNTVTNAGSVSNSFNWAVAAPTGTYTTTFYADDGTTNDFETITITVTNAPTINVAPVLAPIGNQSLTVGDALSFTVSATDANGDDITLSASNLPPGAVFNTVTNAGSASNSFTWAIAAPAGIYSPTFTADDGTTHVSETVTITVSEPTFLLISEIADPAGTGGGDYRFVEIYNAGNAAVDLAAGNWFLSMQANGSSWSDVVLTGTVAAAQTYVIALDETQFLEAYGAAPDQADGNINGTGNDAYVLYSGGDHAAGTLVDIYGEEDVNGDTTDWEYTDSRAVRNNNILEPNITWTASEWTITAGATTADMTPGAHGPAPEFQGLENQFVFLGDNLNLLVTAVNTVKTDIITLSATNRPGDATFPEAVGTNSVSSTLFWEAPPAGIYSVTFAAEGLAGTATESITVTVAATAEIDGYFYGWTSDTIVKLDNGQFWRNTGGQGETPDSGLRNPQVTVTKVYGKHRMVVDDLSYTTVELIEINESTFASDQAGFYNGSIYELGDGTFWKQISFENDNFSAEPKTVWRWTENGETMLRFFDRDDINLGTCEVVASDPPDPGAIVTEIDGYFRGWKNKRVFALANGEFWQQTVADSSVDTLYRPAATLTNWLDTGTWRLTIDGASAPGYVEVQQLTNVTRTAIDGWFYGFGNGEFFHLQNDEWWRQTSLDSSASTRSNPEVLIWNDDGTNIIEMPDEGRAVSAEQLTVLLQTSVFGGFSGLHYGNTYLLNNLSRWLQISFENISNMTGSPEAVLWADGSLTALLLRDDFDQTIGTCTVVDPDEDADGDQIANAAELIAGTALDDAEDLFLITNIDYDEEDRAVLSWNAVEGRSYSVEWTPSLNETFQPLENGIEWPQNTWIDTVNPPASGGFYRLRVQLEN